MSWEYPRCSHSCGEKCFAYLDGGCLALSDTRFLLKECPFFKEKKKFEEEKKAIREKYKED